MKAGNEYNRPVLLLLMWLALPAAAQLCNSPPVAVDDEASFLGGPVVVDVLANDRDPDGEALEVLGLTTTCGGTLGEDFGLVTLDVSSVAQDCTITYQVWDESGASATGTVTVRATAVIFADGFETGDTSRWDPGGSP